MIVYFNGSFISRDKVAISPDDRGFVFADGIYEVLRVYNGKLFCFDAHLARLKRSLDETRINFPEVEKLRSILNQLIQKNSFSEKHAQIYIQITRGVAPRSHPFPKIPVTSTVFIDIFEKPVPELESCFNNSAVLLEDQRWQRCDIKSVSLLPGVLANQYASEQGAREAIFYRNEVITEGSHTNVMAVINGTVFTHPLSKAILPGVTRSIILELCRKFDIPFKEQAVTVPEFLKSSEIFIAGSISEIVAITNIADTDYQNETAGPVTVKLIHEYRKLTARGLD